MQELHLKTLNSGLGRPPVGGRCLSRKPTQVARPPPTAWGSAAPTMGPAPEHVLLTPPLTLPDP